MCSQPLTIGALADQTGCNVPTIRYYEEIGLLPPARRRPGGHRFYSEADLRRLTFIRRCRDFGFPIEQVRALVELTEASDRDCNEARDLAQAHSTTSVLSSPNSRRSNAPSSASWNPARRPVPAVRPRNA